MQVTSKLDFAGYDETYAEMKSTTKNGISHRRRAVDALRDYFTKEEGKKLTVDDDTI